MPGRLQTSVHALCDAIRVLPGTDEPLQQIVGRGIDRGKYDATLPIRQHLTTVLGFLQRFAGNGGTDRFARLPRPIVDSLVSDIEALLNIVHSIPVNCQLQTTSVVPPSFHGSEAGVARGVENLYGRLYSQLAPLQSLLGPVPISKTDSSADVPLASTHIVQDATVVATGAVSGNESGAQPHQMTELECVKELEAEKSMMIAVSTGGPRIENVNQEYINRRLGNRTFLLAAGIPDPNPYDDLWAWYGKWSSGDLPTYQSRRQYLSELFQPAIQALTRRASGVATKPIAQPTGWPRVDRGVDAAQRRLETAKSEEEFQTVGLLCRETLISLAQAVYDPAQHVPADGVTPSPTDAFRMLDAYFGAELSGGSNEATRGHARASLKLANELQHRRTASLRDASLCAEATRSVVNIVAIISGRR